MTFTKFIEIGAVVYVNSGIYKGKLAAIVNIVDQTRLLVDGPCSSVPREVVSMKQVQLTKFKIPISVGARTVIVKKAWEKVGVTAQWTEGAWAKSLANKHRRANLSDFERFKLMKLKQKRRVIISREVKRLVKEQKSA